MTDSACLIVRGCLNTFSYFFNFLDFWFFSNFLDISECGRDSPDSSDGFFLLRFGIKSYVVSLNNPVRLKFLFGLSDARDRLCWFLSNFLDNSESGKNCPGSSDGFFLLRFGRSIPVVTLRNPIRLEFLVDPSAA